MTRPFWKNRRFWKRVLGVAGVLVLLAMAAHPELRLLVPFLDAIGFDALLALLGAQAISVFADTLVPVLTRAWGRVAPWLAALDRATSPGNVPGSIRALGGCVLGQYSGFVGQYLWACSGRFWRMACQGPGASAGTLAPAPRTRGY